MPPRLEDMEGLVHEEPGQAALPLRAPFERRGGGPDSGEANRGVGPEARVPPLEDPHTPVAGPGLELLGGLGCRASQVRPPSKTATGICPGSKPGQSGRAEIRSSSFNTARTRGAGAGAAASETSSATSFARGTARRVMTPETPAAHSRLR